MKQKILKAMWMVALLIGIFTSCKKDDGDQENLQVTPPKYYTYLKTGNRWVYDMMVNNVVRDSFTRVVLSQDSSQVFTIESKDKVLTLKEYFFVKDNNLMYFSEGQTQANAIILMKQNLKAGDQWMKKMDNDTVQVTVKALDKQVETANGVFVCTSLEEKNLRTGQLTITDHHQVYGMIQLQLTYNGQPIKYLLRSKNF